MSKPFLAHPLIPGRNPIKVFHHTYYITGEDREQLWWSIKQRIEFCQWCISHSYTSIPNYDLSSFEKWQLKMVLDPIDIFEKNLKLKQNNIAINYQLISTFLTEIADRLAGTNKHKIDKTQYDDGKYFMKNLLGLDYGKNYLIYLYNYKNPNPI